MILKSTGLSLPAQPPDLANRVSLNFSSISPLNNSGLDLSSKLKVSTHDARCKIQNIRCKIQDPRCKAFSNLCCNLNRHESCIMYPASVSSTCVTLKCRISIMNESIDKKDALNSSKSHQQNHSTRIEEAELCDRCHQPMFRMRAVYWCVNCGYKTDCCGS